MPLRFESTIPTVEHDGVRYEVCEGHPAYCQRSGILRAVDLLGERESEVWSRAVYWVDSVPRIRRDQGPSYLESPIVGLQLEDGQLVVTREGGTEYRVTLDGQPVERERRRESERMHG